MTKRLALALTLLTLVARPVWAQRIDGSGVRVNGVAALSNATAYVSNAFCLALVTSDTYIARVGTNDIGFYTGATSCGAGGTLRFDVSATAVTSGVPVLIPDGTAAAPGGAFTTTPNAGWFISATNRLGWATAAVQRMDLGNGRLALTSNTAFGWTTSTTDGTGAIDVSLRRSAAKTLTLDTDSAGGALTLFDVKGPLTASGLITSSGSGFTAAASALIQWTGRTIVSSPADAQVMFTGTAANNGYLIDSSTDATAWFKTRASADTAILKANIVNATGSVGIAATPGSAGSLSWPGTTPGSPVNGDTWIDTNAGNWTTAATTISLKARNNGVTRTIGSVTF